MQSQTHLSIPAAMSLGLDADAAHTEPAHAEDVAATGFPVLSSLGFRQCGPARPRRRSSSTKPPRTSFSTPKRIRPEKEFVYGPPASPIAEVAVEEDKTPNKTPRMSASSVASPMHSPLAGCAGTAGMPRDSSERQAKRLANFMSRFQYAGDDPFTAAAPQTHAHRGVPLNHSQLYGVAQGAIETHAARVRNQLELRAQLFTVGHDYSTAVDGPPAEELRYNPLQTIRDRQARDRASARHSPHHVVNVNETPLRTVNSPPQWKQSSRHKFIWDIQLPEMIQQLSYSLSLYKKRARKWEKQQRLQRQQPPSQPQLGQLHQQLEHESQKYDDHLRDDHLKDDHLKDDTLSSSSSLSDASPAPSQTTLLPAFSVESSASASRHPLGSSGSQRLPMPVVPMRSNSSGTIDSSKSVPVESRSHESRSGSFHRGLSSPYQSGTNLAASNLAASNLAAPNSAASNLAGKSSSMLIDRLRCSHSESSGSDDNETDSDAPRGSFPTRPLFCRNQHSFSKPVDEMPQRLTSITPGPLLPPSALSTGGTSPRQNSAVSVVSRARNSERARRDSSVRSVSVSPTRVPRYESTASPWQSRKASPAPVVVVTSYDDEKHPEIPWKNLGWDSSTSHIPAPHELAGAMTPSSHRKRGSMQTSVISLEDDADMRDLEARDITDFGSLRKNDPVDAALESEQATALATSELEYMIALFHIALRKQSIDLGLSGVCLEHTKDSPLEKEAKPVCDALRLQIKNDTVPQYLQYLGTVEKDVLERQQVLEADLAGPLDSLRVTADRMVSEVNTILNRQLREATARCDRLNACKDSKCLKRLFYTILEWTVLILMWVCWASVTAFRTICKATNTLVI